MKKHINEREGVIKYRLEHRHCDLPPTLATKRLNTWRSLLFRLKLIGQSPEKYHGLGYGNISLRLTPDSQSFLISGTQTGHLDYLKPEHITVVESGTPNRNSIVSYGPCKPSSEALTHASVYLHEPCAQAVIHVHCPEIWHHTSHLNLPHTGADVPYGTVEMAEAVRQLFASGQLTNKPIFSMLGHEDGIVAFGETLSTAAITLLTELADAIAIEQSAHTG